MNFPAWLKHHLFVAFLLFSLLAHFLVMGAVRIYHWRRNTIEPGLIECDYYPLNNDQPEAEAPPPRLDKKEITKREELPPVKSSYLPEEAPPLEVLPPAEEGIDFRAALEKLCPASTPAREETLPEYVERLRGKINSRINYPESALKLELEGSVVVSFSLNRRGKLLSLVIPRDGRSTFAPFNEEALRSVRRASRNFPEFPPSINGEALLFRLPVTFEINKNNKKLSVR